jgi:hypothetical protein
MIIAQNIWQAQAMKKCPTVMDCEAYIARCQYCLDRAHLTDQRDWRGKLSFLRKLRQQLAGGRGI